MVRDVFMGGRAWRYGACAAAVVGAIAALEGGCGSEQHTSGTPDSSASGGDAGLAVDSSRDSGPATSCLSLLNDNPSLVSGEYAIDPDGPDGGLPPFTVYCDMTADAGGWTTLPLRFNDPRYWSITHTGSACIAVDIQGNNGDYRQYQSSNTGTFAYTYLTFIPPVPATSIRFADFTYTNSGSLNSMDFEIGGLPADAGETEVEAWYVANASRDPVGFIIPTATVCTSIPGMYFAKPLEGVPGCSRDLLPDAGTDAAIPVAPFLLNETIALTSAIPNVTLALIEGCGSSLTSPVTDGEQFHIAAAPGSDGVWTTGIQVR